MSNFLKGIAFAFFGTGLVSVQGQDVSMSSFGFARVSQSRSANMRMEMVVKTSQTRQAPSSLKIISNPAQRGGATYEAASPQTTGSGQSQMGSSSFESAVLENRAVSWDSDATRNIEPVPSNLASASAGGGGGGCLLK